MKAHGFMSIVAMALLACHAAARDAGLASDGQPTGISKTPRHLLADCPDCCSACDYVKGECITVKEGWGILEGKCIELVKKPTGAPKCPALCCLTCQDGKCVSVKADWEIRNGNCFQTPKCPECCSTCDSGTGKCLSVKSDWQLHDGKCVERPKCPSCCEECKNGYCGAVKGGWFITEGECRRQVTCPECCGECEEKGELTVCKWFKEGWKLVNGACKVAKGGDDDDDDIDDDDIDDDDTDDDDIDDDDIDDDDIDDDDIDDDDVDDDDGEGGKKVLDVRCPECCQECTSKDGLTTCTWFRNGWYLEDGECMLRKESDDDDGGDDDDDDDVDDDHDDDGLYGK
ncbi:unnamed protein product [Ostreobium quekettii]|uniref:Uncharacterized protein n=1 Tax=Ostreobium quekettii TaxID=121088 RepID=A0A8S1J9T0_9CHLO|nr:unnamed protein product [Ostreobium quekettii]